MPWAFAQLFLWQTGLVLLPAAKKMHNERVYNVKKNPSFFSFLRL
jgi:hypothetical protein